MKSIPIIFIRSKDCPVCQRPEAHVAGINLLLRRQAQARGNGRGVMFLAATYGLSLLSLRRHRDRCLALASIYRPKKEDTGE